HMLYIEPELHDDRLVEAEADARSLDGGFGSMVADHRQDRIGRQESADDEGHQQQPKQGGGDRPQKSQERLHRMRFMSPAKKIDPAGSRLNSQARPGGARRYGLVSPS